MSKLKTSNINDTVWKACDTFRGVIDPSQYKDYILVMLFIKYISDVNKEKRAQYARQYDGNEERIERAMRAERFIIPPTSSFDYLYENRNEPNIGSLIDVALRSEEHTSELQSRGHLVCRLLLEKKKKYESLSRRRAPGSPAASSSWRRRRACR